MGFMRAIIVIDLEIDDGQRPGTRFARLEWVAKSVAGFVVYLRRVRQLNTVTVHPESSANLLPAEGLIDIPIPPQPLPQSSP